MSDNPFASPDDLSAQPLDGSAAVATSSPSEPTSALETGVVPGAGAALTLPPADAVAVDGEPAREPRGRIGGGAVAAIAGGALIPGAIGGFGAAFAYDSVNDSGTTP